MSEVEFKPKPLVAASAVAAVTAIYVYFLIFAGFAFPHIAQGVMGGAAQGVLLALGAAGVAGSVLAAEEYQGRRSRWLLTGGFVVCGVAGMVAALTQTHAGVWTAAVLIGAGTGWTTVTLAAALRRVLGSAQLGSSLGLGTGLAYAICNLPQVFNAAPVRQAWIAGGAAAAGLAAVQFFKLAAPDEKPTSVDYARRGAAAWVVIFLALVWLDTTAFNIIQQTPALKEETWSGDWRLYVNASVHLLAAVLAGYVLDRRHIGVVALAALAALLIAGTLINEDYREFASVGALLYTAGVSFYSTALVFYPARGARPWPAAAVYAVAGWGGSALGLGLTRNLRAVPWWLMAAAGVVVTGALALRQKWRRADRAVDSLAVRPRTGRT